MLVVFSNALPSPRCTKAEFCFNTYFQNLFTSPNMDFLQPDSLEHLRKKEQITQKYSICCSPDDSAVA
uniref:Uncharacterized protein n=1 Tax=Taeniopygia guttata TaxID=59729 RepID=A0A674GS89_TAEGU